MSFATGCCVSTPKSPTGSSTARPPPGQPSRLDDAHRTALAALIEEGPTPAIHGVVRWRIVDLCQWTFEEFRIVVSEQTMSRELRKMGYRKLSARPRHHAQVEGAVEEKSFPARLEEIARAKRVASDKIEIWFEDEARIDQKNKITRRWAKRGSRPSAPHDQRTASTYIFGAVCPKDGKGAALVLPACNTYAMNLLLVEISQTVAPGKPNQALPAESPAVRADSSSIHLRKDRGRMSVHALSIYARTVLLSPSTPSTTDQPPGMPFQRGQMEYCSS